MEHLNLEALARLVDEPLSEDERAHLASCAHCRGELGALVEQTRTLAALPRLSPPAGEWAALMPRLQAEGLLKDVVRAEGLAKDALTAVVTANGEHPHVDIEQPQVDIVDISVPVARRRAGPRTGWTRAAAAILLFAGGAAAGWGARGSGVSSDVSAGPDFATTAATSPAPVAVATTPPAETQTAAGTQTAADARTSAVPASATPDASTPEVQVPDVNPPVSTKKAVVAAAPPEAPLSVFPASPPASIEEALEWVRITEDMYFGSLRMYRGQLESGGLTVVDPVGRYFALGNVLAVTKDAVRRSPADPFLNGLMINTIAEQEATLQLISTVDDGN